MTRDKVLSALAALDADKQVWVAGSAAICPDLASDIDIWILTEKSKLKEDKFDLSIWKDVPPNSENYANHIPVSKRIEVTTPAMLDQPSVKLQVMFTGVSSIWELLDSFDVSCHQFARNIEGFFVAGPKATLPGSPIIRLSEPPYENTCDCDDCKGAPPVIDYTATRIERFTLRYANTTRDMLWLPS